jgi:hypothetical protein
MPAWRVGPGLSDVQACNMVALRSHLVRHGELGVRQLFAGCHRADKRSLDQGCPKNERV